MLVFLLFFGASQESENRIAKVICHFRRFVSTDIFKMPEPVSLSKILFKMCKMQVRIVSDLEQIGKNDLIYFAIDKGDLILEIFPSEFAILN